jgi:hypothetical protein
MAPAYEAKLIDLIKRLRGLVKSPDMPFIAGQMGKFDDVPWNAGEVTVDTTHQQLPKKVPRTAFVSSQGQKQRGDKTHFDSASFRELGKRYAAAYLKMSK